MYKAGQKVVYNYGNNSQVMWVVEDSDRTQVDCTLVSSEEFGEGTLVRTRYLHEAESTEAAQ